MAEPQLSVRSARARDLAHQLAKRERRTIAQVVERALECYARQTLDEEPARAFYARLSRELSADIDLNEVIREDRPGHGGPDL